MAESELGQADGRDGRQVATQDDYEAEAHETTWVDLEDGPGSFEVREVAPLGLLRDMDRYGVMEMMGGASGTSDDIDMAELLRDGDLTGFIEDVVLPNVVQPDVYWDDTGDGDFDLGSLSANDLIRVISGMTGQEPDELQERADEKFRG